jgi:hypothetical protein
MLLHPHITKETAARAKSITAVIKIAIRPVKIAGNRMTTAASAAQAQLPMLELFFALYGYSTHRFFSVY